MASDIAKGIQKQKEAENAGKGCGGIGCFSVFAAIVAIWFMVGAPDTFWWYIPAFVVPIVLGAVLYTWALNRAMTQE